MRASGGSSRPLGADPMRVYTGSYEGSLTIAQDATIQGVVVGDVVVSGPATVDVHGLVTGDLFVEAGATVRVHGRVRGLVTNLGGELVVFGAIGAFAGTGRTEITAGALVARPGPSNH